MLRYSVTTPEPGDKLVLMCGEIVIPFYTALLATKPAATKASGLEVLVQEVMAANTTEPCLSDIYLPPTANFFSVCIFSDGIPKPLNP